MIFPQPLPSRLSHSLLNAEQCTHCGYCLPHCPTYRYHNDESESPRGRISIILALQSGRITPEQTVETLSHCLLCRACHTSCPVGVRPGKLIGLARGIAAPAPSPWPMQLLHWITNRPRWTAWIARLIQGYRLSGLQSLVRQYHLLKFIPKIAYLESLIPEHLPSYSTSASPPLPAPRQRIALMSGCIARLLFPHLQPLAQALAEQVGCEVVVLPDFGCCGAPFREHGDRAAFVQQAKRTLQAFAAVGPVDAVLSESAICTVTARSYVRALEKEPQYAALAKQFSDKVRGLDEFMAEFAETGPWQQANPGWGKLAFHDHCQTRHGLGVIAPARRLLCALSAPWQELPNAGQCCGAGGDYMLRFPTVSQAIGAEKIAAICHVQPDTVICTNPGCIIQMQAGLRRAGQTIPVRHLAELLWAAAQQRSLTQEESRK